MPPRHVQYELWRARISDECWALTGDDCDTAIIALTEGDETERKLYDWIIWLRVTRSLHDDLYRKVSHVKRGMLPQLLSEISQEVPVLRLEFYRGSMQAVGERR